MQVATERLREWFSIYVLQPLLASIEECHIEVVASAAEAGVTGVQLTPLKQLGTLKLSRQLFSPFYRVRKINDHVF